MTEEKGSKPTYSTRCNSNSDLSCSPTLALCPDENSEDLLPSMIALGRCR